MNFVVYSKRGCPYCTKIMSVLEQLSVTKGITVREYTLGEHFEKENFYKEFGENVTFPQVTLEDKINITEENPHGEPILIKHLGGCSDTIKYLQENNLL